MSPRWGGAISCALIASFAVCAPAEQAHWLPGVSTSSVDVHSSAGPIRVQRIRRVAALSSSLDWPPFLVVETWFDPSTGFYLWLPQFVDAESSARATESSAFGYQRVMSMSPKGLVLFNSISQTVIRSPLRARSIGEMHDAILSRLNAKSIPALRTRTLELSAMAFPTLRGGSVAERTVGPLPDWEVIPLAFGPPLAVRKITDASGVEIEVHEYPNDGSPRFPSDFFIDPDNRSAQWRPLCQISSARFENGTWRVEVRNDRGHLGIARYDDQFQLLSVEINKNPPPGAQ